MDISTGDFPIEQLSNAIIKSSMIEYAINIYLNEKKTSKANRYPLGFALMLWLQKKQKNK